MGTFWARRNGCFHRLLSRQKCFKSASLSIIFFPPNHFLKLVGLKATRTHRICKCARWTTVSFHFIASPKEEGCLGTQNTRVPWKNFRVNPAFPSGLGSFSSKTDNALTSCYDDLILFKWISTQRGGREDPFGGVWIKLSLINKVSFPVKVPKHRIIIQSLR